MKQFSEYLSEEMQKKHHVGTCVNSFDDEGSSCNPNIPYHDASHFSNHVQDFKTGGNKKELKITKKDFQKHVHIPKELHKISSRKDTEFLHDKEHNTHIMYDAKKDVHHFFA